MKPNEKFIFGFFISALLIGVFRRLDAQPIEDTEIPPSDLEELMAKAVEKEDYMEAARIRDLLKIH